MSVALFVSVAVALTSASAFLLDDPGLRLKKRERDFSRPICYTDYSYAFIRQNGQEYNERIKCDCSYVGDEEGQVGPNDHVITTWYQNLTCKRVSYVHETLTRAESRAWEIGCECFQVPDDKLDCTTTEGKSDAWLRERFSYLEDQWMQCIAIPSTPPTNPDGVDCSQLTFANGTVVDAVMLCQIAGTYYWG